MKKSAIVALIIAFVMIFTGIGITAYSLSKTDFSFDILKKGTGKLERNSIDEPFDSVEVESEFFDVEIIASESAFYEYTDIKGVTVDAAIENGVLRITVSDNRTWLDRIGIFWNDDSRITLNIPDESYDRLKITTNSGGIKINSEISFKDASAETTSGDVNIFSLDISDDLYVKTTSGDIHVSGIDNSSIEITSTSGSIEVNSCRASEINCNSTSGDIDASDTKGEKSLTLGTTSGDIEFNGIDSFKIKLTAVSGDIEGSVLTEKIFTADTTSGDVRIPADGNTSETCSASTTSGDIEIRLK